MSLRITSAGLLLAAACQRAPHGEASDPAHNAAETGAAPSQEPGMSPAPLDSLLVPIGESPFLAHVDKAEAVFVGVLEAAGPPPTAFSGYSVATQSLTYRVERVLRGTVDQPTMTVHHVIVARSPALEAGAPSLRADVLRVGERYLVAVGGTVEGKRVTANENLPPILATPDAVSRVEAALTK